MQDSPCAPGTLGRSLGGTPDGLETSSPQVPQGKVPETGGSGGGGQGLGRIRPRPASRSECWATSESGCSNQPTFVEIIDAKRHCSFCRGWLAVQARARDTSLQPAAGPVSFLRVAEAKVRPKDGIALPGQAEQSLSRPTADNTRPDRAANGRMGRGRGTRKFKEQGVTGDLLTWGSALFLEHAGP